MKFTKRIALFVAICLLASFLFAITAGASENRLIDEAGLLSQAEREEISDLLDQLSKENEYEILIVTTPSIGMKDPLDAAADYWYDAFGLNDDTTGTLLLLSMENRDYAVISQGEGKSIVPDESYLAGVFLNYLSQDDYYRGLKTFAQEVNSRIEYKRTFPVMRCLIIALVVGFIIALIATSVMKSKLKSVKYRDYAREYVRRGSFNLAHSRDLYLYSTVTRVPKPKPNNNGGGGGSFKSGGFSGGKGKF